MSKLYRLLTIAFPLRHSSRHCLSLKLIVLGVLLILSTSAIAYGQNADEEIAALGRYIVKINDAELISLKAEYPELQQYSDAQIRAALINSINTEAIEELPLIDAELVQAPHNEDLDIPAAVDSLDAELLDYISPDYVYTADAVPDDPYFGSLWGLHQSSDIDIDAPEAWEITVGESDSDVVVAVIDTGVDWNHNDLQANMWINEAEANGTGGVDDDGNGIVDDVHGYNAITQNGNPMDDQSTNDIYHGTHCSGTIGAVGNNGIGITGVAWNAKIMAIKFLDSAGHGYTSGAIRAINYAVMMKDRGVNIRVLSNSWGGGGYSTALSEAINQTRLRQMLFVASAGNDASNNDSHPAYPASYNHSNIISVAAIQRDGQRASFSNYGANSVDIAAPGVSIYSTIGGSRYRSLNGTSMACPHVSGAAALFFSKYPQYSADEVKGHLMDMVTVRSNLEGVVKSSGVLNVHNLLSVDLGNYPPNLSPIADQRIQARARRKLIPLVAVDPEDEPLSFDGQIISPEHVNDASIEVINNPEPHLLIESREGFLGEFLVRASATDGNRTDYETFTVEVYNTGPDLPQLGDQVMSHTQDILELSLPEKDADEDPLSYTAEILDAPEGFSGTVDLSPGKLSIDPPAGFIGSFKVELSVTDGVENETTTFTVMVINHAPELSAIGDKSVYWNRTLQVELSASDEDEEELSYSAEVIDYDGEFQGTISLSENNLTITPPNRFTGTFKIKVTVEDISLSDSEVFSVEVTNSTPKLGTVDTSSRSHRNVPLNLTLSATDKEGDPLEFTAELLSSDEFASLDISKLSDTSAKLRISTTDFYVGEISLAVFVSDSLSSQRTPLLITLTNAAPELAPIANQEMTTDSETLAVSISASDSDNDPITLSAYAYTEEVLAYDLDQQYDFGIQGNSYYTNLRGQGEKYLYTASQGQWYVLLPDGMLYLWYGSFDTVELISTVPLSFYEDPSQLFDVEEPELSTPATVSFSGSTLSISPTEGFLGTFMVRVTADDGWDSSSKTFSVTRINSAPVLSAVPNQILDKKNGRLEIALEAMDADNDPLSFSAHVGSFDDLIFELDQEHDFGTYAPGEYYTNMRGENEKYLYSAKSDAWFVILPDGSLWLWKHNFEESSFLAQLPISYYFDPSLLFDVIEPNSSPPAKAELSANMLSLSPLGECIGSFPVGVTVSDGELTDTIRFVVTCRNNAPQIESIEDRQLFQADLSLSIKLEAEDPDGDDLSFSARIASLSHMTYELDREHNFAVDTGGYYDNLRGQQEKYLRSFDSGNWYMLLPDGSLYFLDGSFNTSQLLARLTVEYYENPQLLIDVAAPTEQSPASITIENSTLLIEFSEGYFGRFFVEVSVSDGAVVDSTRFAIDVWSDSTDSDGDGVNDIDELKSGSDPFDAGSFIPNLKSPIYALWNSFLEMFNILEVINPSQEDKYVTVTLYAMDGTAAHQEKILVPAQSQFDLILNDVPGFTKNAYGIVKLEFEGIIDGRMFYYRTMDNFQSYEFAFGIPLSNANYGPSSAGFNTFRASLHLEELEYIVQNWLTIVNLASTEKRFSVVSYDQDGNTLRSEELVVPPFGRSDIDGGHDFAGPMSVGLHSIIPEDSSAPYIAQLIRYGGDAPPAVLPASYSFAFPLVARAGTGRHVKVPISKQFGEENWLEVANTLAEEVEISIRFLSTAGVLLDERTLLFAPHSQRHFNASLILGEELSGIAEISSSEAGAAIAQSMFYFRESATGRLDAMYGSQAREALTRAVFGSYNLFLGMENWLTLVNNSESPAQVQVIIHNAGTSTENILELPGNGSKRLALHNTSQFGTSPNTYGTVEARITEGSHILAELLRIRPQNGRIDFAAPTEVR